jgi:glycosyltransferase involved in cell wall biosynthesis
MTRVVYWNNIPAPYMVERFNGLARRGNLDFEVWFSARTERDRSWSVDEGNWRFSFRYLPAFDRGTAAVGFPTPLLRGRRPDVFVSLYAGVGYLAGSALARLRGARTAFWVEVTYDAWVRRRHWKEALKSHILPGADGILTAGSDGRSFALRYGAREDRIHIVPHVIDFDRFSRESRLSVMEREALRSELGVRGVTFIYVGRLWTGKGLTYLLDAFRELQHQMHDVSLVLVGDGVDEGALRAKARVERVDNVVFCGFQQGDMLARLYAAADVFVFPTLGDPFGMVVLEAMACGLPVIATTASGEIADRVVHGLNGFLVPPADSAELLERMTVLARDADLRRRMASASVTRVAGQAPESWAVAFEEAVDAIVSMPRIRDDPSGRLGRLRAAARDRLAVRP